MGKKRDIKRSSIHADPLRAKAHGKDLQQTNPYLETQRSHNKWYAAHELGKQRQMPRLAPKEQKKPKKG